MSSSTTIPHGTLKPLKIRKTQLEPIISPPELNTGSSTGPRSRSKIAVTRTPTQPISCKNDNPKSLPSMNTLITQSRPERVVRKDDDYNKSRKPINPLLGPVHTGAKSSKGIRTNSIGRASPTPGNDNSLNDKTNIISTEKSTQNLKVSRVATRNNTALTTKVD